MPSAKATTAFLHLNERMTERACGKCGSPMRIRLHGQTEVGPDKEEATYVCECENQQTYIEYLKPDLDFR